MGTAEEGARIQSVPCGGTDTPMRDGKMWPWLHFLTAADKRAGPRPVG